jgi:hypothetical protein
MRVMNNSNPKAVYRQGYAKVLLFACLPRYLLDPERQRKENISRNGSAWPGQLFPLYVLRIPRWREAIAALHVTGAVCCRVVLYLT